MRKRVSDTFPEKEMIRRVYRSLGDYYIIAEGYGLDAVFPFDLADFCMKFKLPVLITHNALKILQQAGYLELTDEQDNSSQVLFIVGKEDLYSTRLTTDQDKLIHVLLRSYTGLFTEPAYISEDIIASRLSWEKDKVYKELVGLAKDRIVRYIPRKQVPFITYVHEREAPERLNLGKETYDSRKERFVSRAKSILDYAKEQNVCRNQLLLSYFGEKNTKPCGQCDVCLKKQEQQVTDADFDKIRMAVLKALTDTALTPEELVQKLAPFKKQKVLQVIRFLLDNGVLKQNKNMKLLVVA